MKKNHNEIKERDALLRLFLLFVSLWLSCFFNAQERFLPEHKEWLENVSPPDHEKAPLAKQLIEYLKKEFEESQAARVSCPAREEEAGSEANVGRGNAKRFPLQVDWMCFFSFGVIL